MKIKTSELRIFKSNATAIKGNTLLQVLSYLKFHDGTIIKHNLHAFLIQKVTTVNESFLVDEKILMGFIDNTRAEEIEIKIKDKRILISEVGGKAKITSPTDDVINFPTIEDEPEEKIILSKKVLNAIKIASNFIVTETLMPLRSHVFIGKKNVGGSNSFIGYLEAQDEELPQIILSKEVCAAISRMGVSSFSQSQRYHYFENGNIRYGFIKPDCAFFDLTPFGVFDKKKLKHFSINKDEFIMFNDMCLSSTPSKIVRATFTVEKNKLKLQMIDTEYEINNYREIDIDGEMEGEFTYQPVYMSHLLKSIPDSDLIFYQSHQKYYITGDGNFAALIMQVIPETNS